MKNPTKELHWFEEISGDEKAILEDNKVVERESRPRIAPKLEKHAPEMYSWLHAIARKMGAADRMDWAYHAFKGVLHTLRDRMPPEEVFQLSAQLPLLIRGIYFEGYKLAGKPDKINKHELLKRIDQEMGPASIIRPETVFGAVLQVLYDHVSEGEMRDILATMPADIKEFWKSSLENDPIVN